MTRHTISLLSLGLLVVATGGCTNTPPRKPTTTEIAAITPGVPGGTFTTRTEVSARVTFKDNAKRTLTLLGGDGKQQTVAVPQSATNFERINAGDLVVLTVTEQVAVAVTGADTLVAQGDVAVVSQAEKGEQPGGAVVVTAQIRGTVTAIDLKLRTATMRTDDGHSLVVPVRPDIDLSKHRIGDQVVMRTTQMVEISVEQSDSPSRN